MNNNTNDHFIKKAKNYDKDKNRVENVANIASKILDEVDFNKDMHVMDFGAGTGMLLSNIAPHIKKVTAVDISKAMINTLKNKQDQISCDLDIKELDLSIEHLDIKFDAIISSMTMHHIEDIKAMLKKFHSMLDKDGILAISDLEEEDGTFHKEDTGIFHFGFDKDDFLRSAKEVGFRDLKVKNIGNVIKPYGVYPIFLLTGKK